MADSIYKFFLRRQIRGHIVPGRKEVSNLGVLENLEIASQSPTSINPNTVEVVIGTAPISDRIGTSPLVPRGPKWNIYPPYRRSIILLCYRVVCWKSCLGLELRENYYLLLRLTEPKSVKFVLMFWITLHPVSHGLKVKVCGVL